MFLCMLARARSEHTEPYCWPELLMSFGDKRTKIPSSSICLAMSCPAWKISSGRQWVQMMGFFFMITAHFSFLFLKYIISVCPYGRKEEYHSRVWHEALTLTRGWHWSFSLSVTVSQTVWQRAPSTPSLMCRICWCLHVCFKEHCKCCSY